MNNLEKYKTDLEKLISDGNSLANSMSNECAPEQFEEAVIKSLKEKAQQFIKDLPSFKDKYQYWYSEALVIIKLLLPDRLEDFVNQYNKPKIRKVITNENYTIEDYLQGLNITRGWEKELIVGPSAAIPRFQQQLNILKSVKKRFESKLFDIKQLVQADLFDSELEAARELNRNRFVRGAGAIAGVVLEGHLTQVCDNHKVKILKKDSSINDLNQLLKDQLIIEIIDWRFIQHLGDLRNLCDHKKEKDPTKEQIEDLISGVEKITKTLF